MSDTALPPLARPELLVGPGDRPVYTTPLGALYHGDCLALMRRMEAESQDMVFADPPFNLDKDYGPGVTDAMLKADYLAWNRAWLAEAVRVLKPGGSLFVFNLPVWLIDSGAFLNEAGLTFRHWIACRMPKGFPRGDRMSPAHYGCLYYTKGDPKTFNKVYAPVPTCRHCHKELRDYGGHRRKLNLKGINLTDVFEVPEEVWSDAELPMPPGEGFAELEDLWDDIPTVRHTQHKVRGANELAPLLLERLISMATNPGDIVFDPFGGAGTTYLAAERLGRRWLGVELGQIPPITGRLESHFKGELELWETARGAHVMVARKAGQKARARAAKGPAQAELSLGSPAAGGSAPVKRARGPKAKRHRAPEYLQLGFEGL